MYMLDGFKTVCRRVLCAAVMGVAAMGAVSCSSSSSSPSSSEPEAEPVVVTNRHRAGGTDITFFVASDTHFGYEGLAEVNRLQIKAMNALPGTKDAFGTGVVAKPLGVLISGDLTDYGRDWQWEQFVKHYGLDGTDGMLKYPVFEATGNHDRYKDGDHPVLAGVKKRHGSLNYSWNWGDVHIACADESPRGESLRWLKRDLASVGREMPIVIYFHFSIEGPYSDYWNDQEKEAFRKAIEGFNVIGIFHGHFHASRHTQWQGHDIYNVGAAKHGQNSFAVVRITDTQMTVASWDYRRKRWQWRHKKKINQSPTTAPAVSEIPAG